MDEEKQYLNTFAVISFEKENENTTLKYEYFLDSYENMKMDEDKMLNNLNNIIEYKNYWLVFSNDNKLKKISSNILSDNNINNIFLGPFSSKEALEYYIAANNIEVDDNIEEINNDF